MELFTEILKQAEILHAQPGNSNGTPSVVPGGVPCTQHELLHACTSRGSVPCLHTVKQVIVENSGNALSMDPNFLKKISDDNRALQATTPVPDQPWNIFSVLHPTNIAIYSLVAKYPARHHVRHELAHPADAVVCVPSVPGWFLGRLCARCVGSCRDGEDLRLCTF